MLARIRAARILPQATFQPKNRSPLGQKVSKITFEEAGEVAAPGGLDSVKVCE
jgi:hypothetical protein